MLRQWTNTGLTIRHGVILLGFLIVEGVLFFATLARLISPEIFFATFIAGVLVFAWVAASSRLNRLRRAAELKEAGYRVCARGGYSLQGLEDKGACPECGTRYEAGRLKRTWVERYTDRPPWGADEPKDLSGGRTN